MHKSTKTSDYPHFTAKRALPSILILALIAVSISIYLFSSKGMMSISWTFPYFSGAANFEKLFDWQISPADYDLASRLTSQEYLNYRHQQTDNTIAYGLNSYGYVLVALLSRSIFYWCGDIQGIIYLQILIHLLICLFFITFAFTDNKTRLLFVFLYAANPLVIYFATFPFYYFWLCLPSACFAILMLKPLWCTQIMIVSTPVLLISLLIRPTTVFLCFLFFIYAYKLAAKANLFPFISTLSVFSAGLILFASVNPRLPPWHTMYIGFGGYANTIGIANLSDDEGYQYFFDKTSIKISTNPITGNWGQPALMKSYNKTIREEYFRILMIHPGFALKNALINLGQVFSVGYIDKRPLLSLLSSFAGWCIIIYLLIQKQYSWVLAVICSALSFFWYFPPIPAYNYASYFLLACGIISSTSSRYLQLNKKL